MKKIIVAMVLTLGIFLFGVDKTYAWIDLPDFSGLGEAVQDAADQTTCESAKPKIHTKFTKLNGVCRSQYDRFNSVISRLDAIINQARWNGYDIDRLKNDRNIFKSKYNAWKSDCDTMYSILYSMAVASYSCQSNTNQSLDVMKSKLSSARSYTDKAKEHAKDVKEFYREVIRDDINVLKNQRYREEVPQNLQ